MIPPGLIIVTLASAMLLVVGSVVPADVFGEDERIDLEVTVPVAWHPIQGGGSWTMEPPGVTVVESKLIDIGAYLRNLIALTSGSQTVQIVLEDAQSSHAVKVVEQSTGKGGVFGSEKTIRATLRNVPAGEYTLTASILDDSGNVLASRSRAVNLVTLAEAS